MGAATAAVSSAPNLGSHTPAADQGPTLAAGSIAQACLEVWDKVLGMLANQREGKLVVALTACRLGNNPEGGLNIEVPDLTDCECLFENTVQHEQMLGDLLAALVGQAVAVQIRGAPGSSSRGRYRKAENDPLVQQIRATFEAEILAFEPMSEAEWDKHLERLQDE